MTTPENKIIKSLSDLIEKIVWAKKLKYQNIDEVRQNIDMVIEDLTDYWDFLNKMENIPTKDNVVPFRRKE